MSANGPLNQPPIRGITMTTDTIPLLVAQMHEKFDLTYDGPPRHLDSEERMFRIAAMQEELDEYVAGGPLVDQYDALLDLLVFTVGTLYRQGFPVVEGFEAVMRANMKKQLGSNGDKRGGFKRDLVKPTGWFGPETALRSILNEAERAGGSHG